MSLYWKIACWVLLVGTSIGLIYGLINTNIVSTFQIVWMALQLAVTIKTLELAKDLEINNKQ